MKWLAAFMLVLAGCATAPAPERMDPPWMGPAPTVPLDDIIHGSDG